MDKRLYLKKLKEAYSNEEKYKEEMEGLNDNANAFMHQKKKKRKWQRLTF